MRELHIGLAVIGGLVLVLGIFSSWIKDRSFLSAPLLALLLGIVLGPFALGVIDPMQWAGWEEIVEETARLTLSIGLMAVALRLPQGYFRDHWRPITVMLSIVIALMWLASSLVAFLLLDQPILSALLIGAIITPTDPVVASSIITSKLAKHAVPDRVRHLMSAESGANDGLAYLFVFLPLLLLERTAQQAWSQWLTSILLIDVFGALAIGGITGYVVGRLLKWAEAEWTLERTGFLSITIALSMLTIGVSRLFGRRWNPGRLYLRRGLCSSGERRRACQRGEYPGNGKSVLFTTNLCLDRPDSAI